MIFSRDSQYDEPTIGSRLEQLQVTYNYSLYQGLNRRLICNVRVQNLFIRRGPPTSINLDLVMLRVVIKPGLQMA